MFQAGCKWHEGAVTERALNTAALTAEPSRDPSPPVRQAGHFTPDTEFPQRNLSDVWASGAKMFVIYRPRSAKHTES